MSKVISKKTSNKKRSKIIAVEAIPVNNSSSWINGFVIGAVFAFSISSAIILMLNLLF